MCFCFFCFIQESCLVRIFLCLLKSFQKFFDLQTDPYETHNLLGAMDARAQASLKRLMAQAGQFPKRDSDPKYRQREALSWDLPVTVKSQQWKLVGAKAQED